MRPITHHCRSRVGQDDDTGKPGCALIVNGVDPGRILLLTFARRAASEMTRRVARIVAEASGGRHRCATSPIGWSGTFHGVGARLLRQFAPRIGLSPTFTIHDREDASHLLNLVRHDRGLSDKKMRFPLKATCLGIYSHAVNSNLQLDEVLALRRDNQGETRIASRRNVPQSTIVSWWIDCSCFLVVKSGAVLAAHLDSFRHGSPQAARADAVKVAVAPTLPPTPTSAGHTLTVASTPPRSVQPDWFLRPRELFWPNHRSLRCRLAFDLVFCPAEHQRVSHLRAPDLEPAL